MPRKIRIGHVRNVRMSGDMGAYSAAGQAASLLATRFATAAVGAYSVTGQAASFSTTGVPAPAPSSPALAGSYRYQQPYLFQAAPANYPSTLGGSAYNPDIWGPRYTYVDSFGGWRWTNPGGDYLGANGLTQASATPFASFAANSASGDGVAFRYTGINVTTLLQYVATNNKWAAFMMRLAAGSQPRAVQSNFTTGHADPVIHVTYANGTSEDLPCWLVAQDNSSDATVKTRLQQTYLPAFIEFKRPAGAVASATLDISIMSHYGGASATVQLFLCNPPINAEPVTGTSGLASSAGTLDSGIGSVPGVKLFQRYIDGAALSDFSVGGGNYQAEELYSPEFWGGPVDTGRWPYTLTGDGVKASNKWLNTNHTYLSLVSSSYTGEGFEPLAPGLGALRLVMPDEVTATGQESSFTGTATSDARLFFSPADMGYLDEVYLRYYVRLGPMAFVPSDRVEQRNGGSPAWSSLGGKWGIMPAHYAKRNDAGGYSGSSGGGLGFALRNNWEVCEVNMGGPDEASILWGHHMYDFGGSNPVNYQAEGQAPWEFGQQGGLGSNLYANRWYLVEQRIKLNGVISPSGYASDGVMQTWIDGRLSFERTGLVLRSLPRYDPGFAAGQLRAMRDLGFTALLWNFYNGGVDRSAINLTVFYTGLVAGTSRIGPMRLPAPSWAASVPNDTWTTLPSTNFRTWALANIPGPESSYLGSGTAFSSIVDAFCDPANNEEAQYFYGGGHGDGLCNAVVKFDLSTLTYSLAGTPTPASKFPPGYGVGGASTITYPSGYKETDWVHPSLGPWGGYFLPAPPLTDAADTPYATPLARSSTHMYAAAAMRGSVIHYFYLTYGEFDTSTGTWVAGGRNVDIGARLNAFGAGYGTAPLSFGTVAIYDDVTDRFFVTLNPGDFGGVRNGLMEWNPVTRTVAAVHSAGSIPYAISDSCSVVKVNRKLYIFTKDTGGYYVEGGMNQGRIFDMDTKTWTHFTVSGSTSGTICPSPSSASGQDTIPAWYDGTKIHRWNYRPTQRANVHSIDLTPVSGTGTLGSPYVLNQTQRTLSGTPPSTVTYVYKRVVYVPSAGCALVLPHANTNYIAIRLS